MGLQTMRRTWTVGCYLGTFRFMRAWEVRPDEEALVVDPLTARSALSAAASSRGAFALTDLGAALERYQPAHYNARTHQRELLKGLFDAIDSKHLVAIQEPPPRPPVIIPREDVPIDLAAKRAPEVVATPGTFGTTPTIVLVSWEKSPIKCGDPVQLKARTKDIPTDTEATFHIRTLSDGAEIASGTAKVASDAARFTWESKKPSSSWPEGPELGLGVEAAGQSKDGDELSFHRYSTLAKQERVHHRQPVGYATFDGRYSIEFVEARQVEIVVRVKLLNKQAARPASQADYDTVANGPEVSAVQSLPTSLKHSCRRIGPNGSRPATMSRTPRASISRRISLPTGRQHSRPRELCQKCSSGFLRTLRASKLCTKLSARTAGRPSRSTRPGTPTS